MNMFFSDIVDCKEPCFTNFKTIWSFSEKLLSYQLTLERTCRALTYDCPVYSNILKKFMREKVKKKKSACPRQKWTICPEVIKISGRKIRKDVV